jgi:hypothetical protein
MSEETKDVAVEEMLQVARAALDESATYVEHISSILAACAQQLQAGEDQAAMMSFARGTSDLQQFVELLERMTVAANPTVSEETHAFRRELFECIRQLESALIGQDYIALSDGIEGGMLPLFPRWDGVRQELSNGLAAQGA